VVPIVLGKSYQGRSIDYFHFGPERSQDSWLLFLGGVHGNEPEGVWLLEEAIRNFSKQHPEVLEMGVGFIPKMNPDGLALSERCNSRQVDLNRNLPSKDWSAEIKNPKYPPGSFAGSEVENQILVDLILENRPLAILSAHSFHRYQININGPSRGWGETIHKLCGYPITEDIGYPTPGCLGTFAGKELGIPTITLEIERGLSREKVVALHLPVVFESIRFWTKQGKSK